MRSAGRAEGAGRARWSAGERDGAGRGEGETHDGEPCGLEDLRELVQPRIWAPRALLVLEELPRTDNGKVDRVALAELVARRADGP